MNGLAGAGHRTAPLGKPKILALLLLLTFAALLLHGYHPWAEDAEIYVPGVVHALHPATYAVGRQFFQAQTNLTLFTKLVAWSVLLSHLPLDWVLFLWQIASIFLLLLGCWKIAAKCFPTLAGRLSAVGFVAALLTLPIANTGLYILDQYFNPRSLAAFAVVFAIDAALESRYFRAALWLLFMALVQPLMAVFGISCIVLLYLFGKERPSWAHLLPAWLIPVLLVSHPSKAYLMDLNNHQDMLLFHWPWYGWLGAVAPLGLLWWFGRIGRSKRRLVLPQLTGSLILFALIYLAGAVLVSIPESLVTLLRFQPMRNLFLVYLFLILLGGGLLGETLLRAKPLCWLLVFVPLCAGMCLTQFQLFPASRHVEWPGAAPKNRWVQAFVWIRTHTPTDAIFALAPHYDSIPGEDHQGFRAIAERSPLADTVKDLSVASLFPNLPLAEECYAQTKAVKGWQHFTRADFERLRREYGVTWVVVQGPGVAGMSCPYRNSVVSVCQVN